MKQKSVCCQTVIVNLSDGLHLRPLAQIAQLAGRFGGDVRIISGTVAVDAKSQLELMTLKAEFGTSLVVEATGEGASAAVEDLVHLFESGFQADITSNT